MTATEEIMQLVLTAPEARKMAALSVLRGEAQIAEEYVPGPPPTVEPFLTLQEVGKRLGLSPCSLWRWKVPGHDLGGRRRYRILEVAAYLESTSLRGFTASRRPSRPQPKQTPDLTPADPGQVGVRTRSGRNNKTKA